MWRSTGGINLVIVRTAPILLVLREIHTMTWAI